MRKIGSFIARAFHEMCPWDLWAIVLCLHRAFSRLVGLKSTSRNLFQGLGSNQAHVLSKSIRARAHLALQKVSNGFFILACLKVDNKSKKCFEFAVNLRGQGYRLQSAEDKAKGEHVQFRFSTVYNFKSDA